MPAGKKKVFADNLRKLRQDRDLKQEDIARELGMPVSTYSSWERGRTQPDIEGLVKLVKYFDTSLDKLIFLEPRPLRIGSWCPISESTEFHPIRNQKGIFTLIYPLVFNRLYSYDPFTKQFHVELIESWRIDRKKYGSFHILNLRQNARFHNGEEMELDDVKFSYEMALQNSFYQRFIKNIEILREEHAIKLELSKWLDLEYLPAPYIIPASCKDNGECFDGTGPFMIADEEQRKIIRDGMKEPLELERNISYFGKIPELEIVEFHRFEDDSKLRQSLKNGAVDLGYDVDLEEEGDSEKFCIKHGHFTLSFYLVFKGDSAVSQNESVRQAIDCAIDRNQLVKNLDIKDSQLLPKLHLYFLLYATKYSKVYDDCKPSAAKEFWKKALNSLNQKGINDPIVRIGCSRYDAVTSKLVPEIVNQLNQLGIGAAQESDSDQADALVEPVGFHEPVAVYMNLYYGNKNEYRNQWEYHNEDVNRLLGEIEDSGFNLETYQEIQDILTEDHFFLPIFHRGTHITYSKELDPGFRLRGANALYGPDIAHWKFIKTP